MFSITEIWNATLTVGSFGAYRGFQAWPRRGALSDTTFEVSSISLRFRALFVRPYTASGSRICVLFQAAYVADYATTTALGELVLEVGGYTLPFEQAGSSVFADQDYCWDIDGLVADSGFDLGSTLAARIVSRASQPTAEIVSRPRDGTAYRSGETIRVLLSFEEDVRVSGSPQLQLEIGAQTRLAAYVPARRGRIAAFDYTVTADDAGSDGVSIRANNDASSPSLLLNGGAFRWVSFLRGEVVPLGFGAVSASTGHAVAGADADTTAPTLSAATIRFRRLVLTYSEPLHFDRIGNRRKEQGLPGAGSSDRVSRRGLRSRTMARRRTGGAALEGVIRRVPVEILADDEVEGDEDFFILLEADNATPENVTFPTRPIRQILWYDDLEIDVAIQDPPSQIAENAGRTHITLAASVRRPYARGVSSGVKLTEERRSRSRTVRARAGNGDARCRCVGAVWSFRDIETASDAPYRVFNIGCSTADAARIMNASVDGRHGETVRWVRFSKTSQARRSTHSTSRGAWRTGQGV